MTFNGQQTLSHPFTGTLLEAAVRDIAVTKTRDTDSAVERVLLEQERGVQPLDAQLLYAEKQRIATLHQAITDMRAQDDETRRKEQYTASLTSPAEAKRRYRLPKISSSIEAGAKPARVRVCVR